MKLPSIVTGLLLFLCAAGAQTAPDALFQAIRNNDLAHLKGKVDVKVRDRRGSTPLMYAAAYGSADAVKLLLDAGADVNAKNSLDATALIWAAADEAKVRMLLAKGANVNAKTKGGRTALMIASTCDGCSGAVRLLLAKGADAKAKDDQGAMPLEIAIEAGDTETARLLLAAGADPDTADDGGDTPLMNAMDECDLGTAKTLLAKGANPNAALTFAGKVKFGNIQLIGLTPLMIAAPYCGADAVQALLDAGAKVNARDIREMTPLMLAVSSETPSVAVVRLLLKAGADVNAKSKTGETALDWAKKFSDPAIVGALTAAGAQEGVVYKARKHAAAATPALVSSVEKGTALLEHSATEFFRQSGCVGCHNQPLTAVAAAAARAQGAHIDEAAARSYTQMIESEWTTYQNMYLERRDRGGAGDPAGYAMWAMAAAKYPANAITDPVTIYLAALQHRAGNWHGGGVARPPMEDGDIARTARAMHALQNYTPPALKPDFDKRVARAAAWLSQAKPVTTDDMAMQIAGLTWAGAGREKLQALGHKLIVAQRQDGGWAQNPHVASDAFATGESLWALRESGALAANDPVYQRGVKYLLSTQWQDGSWYVRSRSPKFQPYFQSGFPFEHDQWVSSGATAWAVLGLTPALEKEKQASR